MGAGIPFFILSLFSIGIVTLWIFNGTGVIKRRLLIGGTSIFILILCWVVLLSYGVFTVQGSWAIFIGFVLAVAMFFIPTAYKSIHG